MLAFDDSAIVRPLVRATAVPQRAGTVAAQERARLQMSDGHLRAGHNGHSALRSVTAGSGGVAVRDIMEFRKINPV